MRSRTSFFNPTLSRHLLRRFWPLWAVWLVLLLFVGYAAPVGNPPESYSVYLDYVNELNRVFLASAVALAQLSALACPLMAMAMLSYLYDRRLCGLYNSLPLRREETYFTAVLTGLLPMLVFDVLVALLIFARFRGVEGVQTGNIWLGLLTVVLANTAFYGFACFCGTLTGHVLILPLVYVLLGLAAMAYEGTIRTLLCALVFGYTYGSYRFGWLAPLSETLSRLNVHRAGTEQFEVVSAGPGAMQVYYTGDGPVQHTLDGLGYLAGFCAAAVLLAVLGVLIVRRRHMETAGEIVAVPLLRPVFRVCMSVGTGLALSAVLSEEFAARLFGGKTVAAIAVVLLCLGAAVGWFAAEMLIRKSLRVFDHGWRPLGIVCAVLVAFALLAEFDVTGYEKRVPDLEDIASVSLRYENDHLTEPETIEAFRDFHRLLIENKAVTERGHTAQKSIVILSYETKDGSSFTRYYEIPGGEAAQNDPDSLLARWQAVMNLPEVILRRAGADKDVRAEAIRYASVSLESPETGWRGDTLRLSAEQAESLYRDGILPDAREGNIARWFAWDSEENRAMYTDTSVTIELEPDPAQLAADGRAYFANNPELDFMVLTQSAHTLEWLRENLDLEPQSRGELEEKEQPRTVK